MKHQVTRFSPHQNGKVFAIMMAVVSAVIIIPTALILMAMNPHGSNIGAITPMLFMPIVYLIMGYLMTALWSWFYNVLVKWTGGIEFESTDVPS